jgi:hypothetical protein
VTDTGRELHAVERQDFDRDGFLLDVRRSSLTRSQKAVLRTIARAVPAGADNCLISVPLIAKAVRLKTRQTQYILRQLEAADWLRVQFPEDWQPGRKCPSRYFPRKGDERCRDGRRREWKTSSDGCSDRPLDGCSATATSAPKKPIGGASISTPRIETNQSEGALALGLTPRPAPESDPNRDDSRAAAPVVAPANSDRHRVPDLTGDVPRQEANDTYPALTEEEWLQQIGYLERMLPELADWCARDARADLAKAKKQLEQLRSAHREGAPEEA